jgi:hypothetical protein
MSSPPFFVTSDLLGGSIDRTEAEMKQMIPLSVLILLETKEQQRKEINRTGKVEHHKVINPCFQKMGVTFKILHSYVTAPSCIHD